MATVLSGDDPECQLEAAVCITNPLATVLSGDDPECQLEAAVCITNLAVGAVSVELAGVVGGYLVTLCGSSSSLLQVSPAIPRGPSLHISWGIQVSETS